MQNYKSGLGVLQEMDFAPLQGKSIGLLTNHTGLARDYFSNIDLINQHPAVDLKALFGPEHGIRGNTQAGVPIDLGVDKYSGLPVYSLYGEQKKPTADMLEGIELMLFDIQDIGVRYYTYVSSLFYLLESCAEQGVKVMVLDRLNPLGRKVEGNLIEEGFHSFVGLYPIPQRHGMTVGELACWVNQQFQLDCQLEIIKALGWQGQYFDQLELNWIPPSPNLPHFGTALVYPLTCLFEGTNLSEGRGTANPFEYIGAPWIDPYRLVKSLQEKHLSGVAFRPLFFQPFLSKYQGEECGGIQVIIEDREEVDSIVTGLTICKAILGLYPDQFRWLESVFEENEQHFFFDLLMGTDQVRKGLEQDGKIIDITADWRQERERFIESCQPFLLY